MKRFLAMILLVGIVSTVPKAQAADKSKEIKEKLQEIQDYIGGWKGTGSPIRGGVTDFWPVQLDWSWRFKKDDIYLQVSFRKDKFWKTGEIRYLPKKEKYQLTITDAKGEARVFEGEKDRGYLTLTRVDPKTKEAQEIKMNTAGDGVRFVLSYSHKPKNRSRFIRDYRLGLTKEGESLGSVAKKKECIVTGGLGTMTVSFKGQTFYVCCSGCRDAFNENPEKYIKEFMKKKR